MTNFIQKMRLDIGFSDFNCLLDSQCSLLTSQILGRCIKLKWSNRAYAVYWLCGTLLCPCSSLSYKSTHKYTSPQVAEDHQWLSGGDEACRQTVLENYWGASFPMKLASLLKCPTHRLLTRSTIRRSSSWSCTQRSSHTASCRPLLWTSGGATPTMTIMW